MQAEEAVQQRRREEEALEEEGVDLEAFHQAKNPLHGKGPARGWKAQGGRRFRWLIRSLMNICAIVSVLWVARIVIDTYIWSFYHTYGRAPAPSIFYTRVITTR